MDSYSLKSYYSTDVRIAETSIKKYPTHFTSMVSH